MSVLHCSTPSHLHIHIAHLRQDLSADPNIYDRLAASIAPSIWQLEDVKRGILCQLFGGVSKVRRDRRQPAHTCRP